MAINALELYCGIGGFHFAVQTIKDVDVKVAMDINPYAVDTYKLNFPQVDARLKNIGALSEKDIDDLNIDLIWLSPPCQPFTRLGKQLGSNDKRTESFIQVMNFIPRLTKKPSYILMENVKGFEISETRRQLLETLNQAGYVYQEFLVSPQDVGIPNSRLRYYLMAKLKPLSFSFPTTTQIRTSLPSELKHLSTPLPTLKEYLEQECDQYFIDYLLPDKILSRYINLLDIVDETSNHSCCFTKGYHHRVEGTGSVLQMNREHKVSDVCEIAMNLEDENKKMELLRSLKLRYFTWREVANLAGFPSKFEFPESVSLGQKYRLLGNSLNVPLLTIIIRLCLS